MSRIWLFELELAFFDGHLVDHCRLVTGPHTVVVFGHLGIARHVAVIHSGAL